MLTSNSSLRSIQGFTVDVHTSEEFKQTNTTSGTLVKRTADDVVLSQKGKRVSIPRSIIREVRLPPSLKEPGDLL